ncbi:hypothetical protein, partial [Methanobrevibacter sp.]|uniref:DUF11 domain-containing protein n=1 Tax=Methanobrevibacter sp. TaxID=66852 RepID=UPI00386473A0
MINRKFIIMSLLILILMSVQCVSASDDMGIDTLGNDDENMILTAPEGESNYAALKNLIDGASVGDVINLNTNYKYAGVGSNDPRTGINITMNLTINGNGAYIDGGFQNGQGGSSLFNISKGVTVTLKNLTIRNSGFMDNNIAYSVITSQGVLELYNCNFNENGVYNQWSDDVKGNGSVINSTNNIFINHCHFENNHVQNYGIVYTTQLVNVNDTYFGYNKAWRKSNGAAIYAKGKVLLNNSYFEENTVSYNYDYYESKGGAIYTEEGIPLIENCNFDFNNAGIGKGGAIYIANTNAHTVIKKSSFYANGHSDQLYGGAIYTEGVIDLIIDNSEFDINTALNGGAIYAKNIGEIKDSEFNQNGKDTDDSKGGSIYLFGSEYELKINNTVFNHHSTMEGGAIYTLGSVCINNSDLNYNQAKSDTQHVSKGGIIYANGDVLIENTNMENNFAKEGSVVYSNGLVSFKDNTMISGNGIDSKGIYSDIGGVIYSNGDCKINCSNFTENYANIYGALYIKGTLDIYDSYFINNSYANAFAEDKAIVNNTWFIDIDAGSIRGLNGRVIGSNSTLNITNSHVYGTTSAGSQFYGSVFSNDDIFVENCTFNHTHANSGGSKGMVVYTNSNATIRNTEFDYTVYVSHTCYGGNVYAGVNAYVENCTFFNGTVSGGQGQTLGLAVYAVQNITFLNSSVEDLYSQNTPEGALRGNYVYVSNSSFFNITGFTADGAAIHANIANVSNSTFNLVHNIYGKGGAIYANNTYVYCNNFTDCSSDRGGAIFSVVYITAIENIFINNTADTSGGAIETVNGFIEYNVFLENKKPGHPDWGTGAMCDILITGASVDSVERNWWGNNTPFEGERGKDRVLINGVHEYPDTWVYMRFFVTDPSQPSVGQGVNLTTTLEDYYVNDTGDIVPLNHNIAKRTVIYNSTNKDTGEVEGKFSHNTAIIKNRDTVLYSNNNFAKHLVSSTIDYQTLYINVTQCEINVTKTVDNKTPKVGQIINYTINVTGKDVTDYSGQGIAPYVPVDIVITDILDPRLELISCNDTNYNNQTGEWTIQGFELNKTYLLSLKVRVKGFGNITNWANVTKINNTDLANPYGGNVTIEVEEPPAYVELVVTKVANVTEAIVGDKIKFTITVENTGTMNATDVMIYDVLPNGFKHESGGSYDPSTRNVTWTISKIEAGSLVSVEVNVTAQSVGKINNTAYANSKENDTVVNGTSDNVTVGPDVHLNVVKEVENGVTSVQVGESIVYI